MTKIQIEELKRILTEARMDLEDAVSEGANGGPDSHVNGAYQKILNAIDLIEVEREAEQENV